MVDCNGYSGGEGGASNLGKTKVPQSQSENVPSGTNHCFPSKVVFQIGSATQKRAKNQREIKEVISDTKTENYLAKKTKKTQLL